MTLTSSRRLMLALLWLALLLAGGWLLGQHLHRLGLRIEPPPIAASPSNKTL